MRSKNNESYYCIISVLGLFIPNAKMCEFIGDGKKRDAIDGKWFDFLKMLQFTVADAKNANTLF